MPTQLNSRIEELLPHGGSLTADVHQVEPPRSVDNVPECRLMQASMAPALSQRASRATNPM